MNMMQYLEQDKKLLIKVIAGILLLVIAFVFYLAKHGGQEELALSEIPVDGIENSNIEENLQASDAAIAENRMVIVDIAGAVVKPRVVELPEGSRVYEAIDKAGGLTGEADIRYINQAELLIDGQKIYIPTKEEIEEGQTDSPVSVSSYHSDSAGAGLININTADSETLQQLPGVGPATADKIIDYRSKNGKFKSIDEITNVSGIGDKTLEKFKDKITI